MGPLACIKATNLERNAVARRCKGLRTSFAAQVNVPISEDITLMLKKGKIRVVSRQLSSDASGQLVLVQLDSSLDLIWQPPVPSHRGEIISLIRT